MKDSLKDFVQNHRDEFDTFTPRPDLWQDIAAELQQEEEKPVGHVEPVQEAKVISLNWHHAWKYAAAIALVIMVAFSVHNYVNTPEASAPLAQNQTVPLEKIAPEVNQIETRFASVIEQKEAQLKEYDLKALGMEKEWEREATTLDSAYTELKKELYTTPNKDVVIQAMSENLKMRIAILNRQLQVLENIQKVKTQLPNETTSI